MRLAFPSLGHKRRVLIMYGFRIESYLAAIHESQRRNVQSFSSRPSWTITPTHPEHIMSQACIPRQTRSLQSDVEEPENQRTTFLLASIRTCPLLYASTLGEWNSRGTVNWCPKPGVRLGRPHNNNNNNTVSWWNAVPVLSCFHRCHSHSLRSLIYFPTLYIIYGIILSYMTYTVFKV